MAITDIKFGVVVAEHSAQLILQAQTVQHLCFKPGITVTAGVILLSVTRMSLKLLDGFYGDGCASITELRLK